jgi:aryl-alcohol dehydrogenase-like predicted oxidoreductase
VDVIDVYQIHWVEPENDPLIEDAWATLVDLKRVGKVAHIGVSNFDVRQLERAGRVGEVETLQPPYSLLARDIEKELLPFCADADIGVIVYSPLQTGLLGGALTKERAESLDPNDARRSDPNFLEPLLSENLARIERLRALAAQWGTTVAQIAVTWALRDPGVSGAIVGFRKPEQVDSLLAHGLPVLSAAQFDAIERIGWVSDSATA